jgi:A/G-specific adenine glycosylase
MVVQDPGRRGLLPQTAKELEKEIPGVGRYTAGAISAIAFGNAECMVDGNVLRVLSRQLGIFGDVKSDRQVIDVLWATAQALVEAAASERSEVDEETGKALPSDVPGRWGQALMELGSTLCTPQPNVSDPRDERFPFPRVT